jgi:hypothetical protein
MKIKKEGNEKEEMIKYNTRKLQCNIHLQKADSMEGSSLNLF